MQQQHSLSGSNPEKIASLASLVEAIKQNQVATPSAKFRLTVGEMKFRVNLLPFGYIEVDGRVQSLSLEKAFDRAIAIEGATLYVN